MINALTTLPWAGILLAFIAYFMLGYLWFTVLFARAYRRSLGRENEDQKKIAPIFIVGPALCCLVITVTSAILIYLLKIDTIQGALLFAVIVGIGYLFANTMNIAINPNIPKPILYGIISGTYHLLGISIVCTILWLMK